MEPLSIGFFQQPTLALAKSLLGCLLIKETEEGKSSGYIVETEAYMGPEDRAAHSYGNRRTKRTEIMYHEAGLVGAPVVRQPALRSADPAAAAVEGVGARPARCRRSASAVARLVRRRAGYRGRGDARVREAHAGRRADGRVAHLRSVGPPAVLRDRRGHDDRVAHRQWPALLISRAVAFRIRRTRP